MIELRLIIGIFLIFISTNVYCQRHSAKEVIPDSLITLKKGIYMNINEFLKNQPSVIFQFDLINDNPDYFLYPEEKNDFYITYYDSRGARVNMNISEIWGYYDGFGIFVNYLGKPYELLYLGRISILRYEHYYCKNITAQAISVFALGGTTTSVEKIKDIYLDLNSDIKLPRKDWNFETLIESDKDFYEMYRGDKKTSRHFKSDVYFMKYNSRHPILIMEDGIKLE